MHNLIPGRWYLTFVCEHCKTRQVLFPDLSDGTSQINAIYYVDCANCNHNGAYDSEIIERFEYRGEEAKQAAA